MATIETIPALVLPGKQVQLVFGAESGGNFVKVWCTSAPRGSKLRKQLDDTQSQRVIVITESDIAKRPAYTFDVGGAYELQIEEFQKGAEAYGGSYRGDPDGHRTEDRITAASRVVSVCTRVEAEIGVSPDTAAVQLYVKDNLIVPTTVAAHGVLTPSITRPATDKAQAAADSVAVTAALAAIPTDALVALQNWQQQISSWITKFNGHIGDATFHANADANNTIGDAFRSPQNLKSIMRTLAECAKKFGQHITNVDASPTATTAPEPGNASYHENGGLTASDWESALLASGGSSMGACLMLFADLHRCLSSHEQNATVHLEADTTHTPISLGAIPALYSAFLDEIAAFSPTTPANEHSAMTVLVSGAGFKRTA